MVTLLQNHRMLRGLGCLAFFYALSSLIGGTAWAADDLNVTKFRPSPHAYDVMTVKFTDIPNGTVYGGGFFSQYGQNPFVRARVDEQTGDQESVAHVRDRLIVDTFANVAVFDRLSLAVAIPYAVINSGGEGAKNAGAGTGDIRASTKLSLMPRSTDDTARGQLQVGAGMALDLTLPTGKKNAFLSDDTVAPLPALIVDASYLGYRAALNVGYRMRDTYANDGFRVDDELDIRMGLDLPIHQRDISAVAQLAMSTNADEFFSKPETNYVEFDYGVQYRHQSGLGALVGGGGSLASGYGNVQMRILGSISYSPSLEPPDSDGDGIPDSNDVCPSVQEDKDGYEDHDGCPEEDNDDDGILDALDACPTDKEDKDGFEDEDGCPEYDNDRDGLSDTSDLCPMDSEDFDGFEDDDGCPETDNDEDGIPDEKDQCPSQPETQNGHADEDGCPDEKPMVQLGDDEILLQEAIVFTSDNSDIDEASRAIITQIADLLEAHPEVTKVEIGVYTDKSRSSNRSQKISKKRAEVLRTILVELFVQEDRLEARGFGRSVPKGVGGEPKNRVTFKVVK